MKYAIQEHHATKLHWDLRLERDGVLKSWAITKEPTNEQGVKRLAVRTPDHELGYERFAGEIKEGYGKGTVKIWDSGSYEEETWTEDKIAVKIKGNKLKGSFVLLHPKTFEKDSWLLFKKK
ncbi:MAG: hypothetical protein HY365_00485 [Candidatus Aenigmarchaeota archaeon]|nr:hypothetical protein [Candidatus Aenigmarchaeota archaeon]